MVKLDTLTRSLSKNRWPSAVKLFWPVFSKIFVKKRNYSPQIFEKSNSKRLSLATVSILGQPPSTHQVTSINTFVQQIRRMLWIELLKTQLIRGFGVSTGILFLLGILNLSYQSMPFHLCLILTSIPLLTVLLITYTHRPTPLMASMYADNHFKGQSLMATAMELITKNNTDNQFAPYVIQQAANSANIWRKQLKLSNNKSSKHIAWIYICLAMISVFLINLPGVSQNKHNDTVFNHRVVNHHKQTFANSLMSEINKQSPSNQQTERNFKKKSPTKDLTLSQNQRVSMTPNQVLTSHQNEPKSFIDLKTKQPVSPEQFINKNIDPTKPMLYNQQVKPGVGNQQLNSTNETLAYKTPNIQIKHVNILLKGGIPINNDSFNGDFDKLLVTKTNDVQVFFPAESVKNTAPVYTSDISIVQRQYIETYFREIQLKK